MSSCNCNTANPICDPCSICTPPGVTGLTTCKPVDPCEGVKLDISCIEYSGIDYPCIGVNNGDGLIDVLLQILALYIPQSKCCELAGNGVVTNCGLAGTINYYTAPTTTTTSTSTTTTTTIAPSCSYKQMTNVATQPSVVSYVPCNSTTYTQVTISTSAMVCSNNAYPVNVISGMVTEQVLSSCNTPAPPTTTSTTTLAPCTCNVYTVYNSSVSTKTILFTQCGIPNFQTSVSILAAQTITVCACADILNNVQSGLVISPAGAPCLVVPTTTTTTISLCQTFQIIVSNTAPGNSVIDYTDCLSNPQSITLGPDETQYICAITGTISCSGTGCPNTNINVWDNTGCNLPL